MTFQIFNFSPSCLLSFFPSLSLSLAFKKMVGAVAVTRLHVLHHHIRKSVDVARGPAHKDKKKMEVDRKRARNSKKQRKKEWKKN